jgi:hypothetical protein
VERLCVLYLLCTISYSNHNEAICYKSGYSGTASSVIQCEGCRSLQEALYNGKLSQSRSNSRYTGFRPISRSTPWKTVMFSLKFLGLALSAQSLTSANRFKPEWRSVSTFPAGGYLESIVVRPNGDILTTHSFVEPGVWTVRNPSNAKTTTSALIAPINSIAVLWGITEVPGLDEETYVIVGGNFSSFTPTTAIEGTEKAF